jgi:hypothetical protein
VSAYQQLRTFVNQPAASYYSTGYSFNVNNTLDANQKPIFAKVVVTTPKGGTLELQPTAGSTFLMLVKSTGVSNTAYLRIRSVYTDPANAAKDPSLADTTLFFANDATIDDAYIAKLPAQSTWKFDYYLASAPTVVAATQYYKTRARSMTIAELQTQPLATIADADLAFVKANTITPTNGNSYLPTPATGPVSIDWTVPTGAIAPNLIRIWSGGSATFNDQLSVASTARTGDIACSKASANDAHCDAAGNFVATDRLSGADLVAEDAAGRQFASFYAFYKVTIQ